MTSIAVDPAPFTDRAAYFAEIVRAGVQSVAGGQHEAAAALGLGVDFRQSNNEGEIVDWIQSAAGTCAGIIINPAAYTHTSIAILDALNLSDVPVIEVHLSNIFQREPFRQESFVSRAAEGVICGFGGHGYQLALEAMAQLLSAGETA
ncbi:MAG: type II 3-dehydroquinate dehydratase [Proteobacteria bacterium]|nr:type II 3-dehydroquinate dehydratase [Pseudomonadota bacterium]